MNSPVEFPDDQAFVRRAFPNASVMHGQAGFGSFVIYNQPCATVHAGGTVETHSTFALGQGRTAEEAWRNAAVNLETGR